MVARVAGSRKCSPGAYLGATPGFRRARATSHRLFALRLLLLPLSRVRAQHHDSGGTARPRSSPRSGSLRPSRQAFCRNRLISPTLEGPSRRPRAPRPRTLLADHRRTSAFWIRLRSRLLIDQYPAAATRPHSTKRWTCRRTAHRAHASSLPCGVCRAGILPEYENGTRNLVIPRPNVRPVQHARAALPAAR